MDISADKYRSNINQLGPFSAILYPMISIIRQLIAFFTLTEKECLAAGIYMGGEGR